MTHRVSLAFVLGMLCLFPAAGGSKRILSNTSPSRASENASDEARRTLTKFLTAFANLDWEAFRSFFADDATVYFPSQRANRATGRAEIEATFRQVFERIRATKTAPPYLNLDPADLDVQLFRDTAVATFHLHDMMPNVIGRRTVVLEKRAGEWKIVHLHASNVEQSQQ
jgi:ketosteroid isomerase-like protein